MKRLISLFLALIMLMLSIIATVACKPEEAPPTPALGAPTPPAPSDPQDPEDPGQSGGGGNSGYNDQGIIIPEYKDYGRGTLNFSVLALDYARPDISALCEDFNAVSEMIRENTASFDDQLAAIVALEDGYNAFLTMYTVAEIFNSKDLTAQFWASEFEYLSSGAPFYSKAVEELYVACALSPHAREFEAQYFEEDISEYESGGKYTEKVVGYMSDEALLESEYKKLSPSTVVITYSDSEIAELTGTYEEVLEALEQLYSPGSLSLEKARSRCLILYNGAYESELTRIYVELLRVRRLLATELGYSSYAEIAYEDMEYDYSFAEMLTFLSDIGDSVFPVYPLLISSTLEKPTPKWGVASLVNNSYSAMQNTDTGFYEIFSYMLQHELYDIAPKSDKRLNGSFTTWIKSNSSPYMFITTTGYIDDYLTVMHEFGHFIDGYVNYNEQNSLEIAELCSQGMELLSLLKLTPYVTASAYDQMIYRAMTSILDLLMYQGTLSYFEHLAYALPYSEITPEAIADIHNEAETEIFGGSGIFTTSNVLILHLFVSPMYVQSYCTSALPALEIYLRELSTPGAGLQAYKSVIYREDESFLELLDAASLTSPFADGALDTLINGLIGHLGPIISKYT